MRKTKEELNAICKKHNIKELWSFSKYNGYKTDKYGWFLKYIKFIKEDRNTSIYGTSGGACHDILENYYVEKNKLDEEVKVFERDVTNGIIDDGETLEGYGDKYIQLYDSMIEEYEAQLMLMDLSELKYNRSDEDKNKKIADKYEYCVRDFFNNHVPIDEKVITEEFILCKINEELVFQGYVDAMFQKGDKFHVVDWKTSTIYSGKKIEKEKQQLVLYGYAMQQKLGIPLDKIVCQWNFLKYVTVGEPQANGKMKYRNIGRHEVGEKCVSKVQMWLKKKDYTEEHIQEYTLQMISDNSFDCLPKEITEMYTFTDCYVDVPFNQESVDELIDDIIKVTNEIKDKRDEYAKTKDDMIWYEPITRESEFFFFNLSGYSRKLHKPLDDYLNEMDMFKGDSGVDSSGYKNDTSGVGVTENSVDTDDNLDWLADLLG